MSDTGGPFYGRYRTDGSEEWMMRLGAEAAPPILILPPLLEEMNRTRALIATIMRRLAQKGFGCWLPDLPGTGESERALKTCSWQSWRAAARDAAKHAAQEAGVAPLVAAFRGGALLDDVPIAACQWRFAPAIGSSLARDMIRASMLAPEQASGPVVELSGYPVTQALLDGLKEAVPAPLGKVRTVRLASDRAEADGRIEGPALWRRSEPSNSPELAEAIALDIKEYHGRCVAC